jgi:hypothetical protein
MPSIDWRTRIHGRRQSFSKRVAPAKRSTESGYGSVALFRETANPHAKSEEC